MTQELKEKINNTKVVDDICDVERTIIELVHSSTNRELAKYGINSIEELAFAIGENSGLRKAQEIINDNKKVRE